MKVLVTGSNGFIGKNTLSFFSEVKDLEIVKLNRETKLEDIEKEIDDVSFVFHLAGVNRPKDVSEFYEGNTNLTKTLVDMLEKHNSKAPIIYTSSIQAQKDNDYGKSKKEAEEIIKSYGRNSRIYRLHNVFGKWCKPNYNSVIATFCYNISRNLDIQVNDENVSLELVYIDDICKEFVRLLNNTSECEEKDGFYYITPRYNITLGEIVKLIKEFKEQTSSIYVPMTGNDFIKKLYSTYISYIPLEDLKTTMKMNIDERGSFTELTRTSESGQFSVSFSKPGIVRGNHYHHTKIERFMVIKGTARVNFTHVLTGENVEFVVSGDNISAITIPVGYTHSIENIGEDEMILAIWCNELFDEKNPDTYFKKTDNENVKRLG